MIIGLTIYLAVHVGSSSGSKYLDNERAIYSNPRNSPCNVIPKPGLVSGECCTVTGKVPKVTKKSIFTNN